MTVAGLPRAIRRYLTGSCALLIAVGAVFTTACASTGATPRPFPIPGAAAQPRVAPQPPPPPPGDVAETGAAVRGAEPAPCAACPAAVDTYALTGTALTLRGTRYRDGGSDPSGFDCSGFTQYVFGQHGIALPRNVKDQFEKGKPVKPAEIAPGDLIFFSTVAPGASHVGIALGGDEFVHAPSSTGVVRVERLASTYWSQRFVGARRLH
jgi:cell wall-associated NlpC family hydrolase